LISQSRGLGDVYKRQLDSWRWYVDITSGIDTRWFQDRLADKRLSQRKLASMMNLDPAAVSLMFRGKRKMSAAEAAEIAKLIGVSPNEVLVRAGADATYRDRDVQSAPRVVHDLQAKSITTAPAVATSPDVLEVPVPMSDGTLAKLLLPMVLTKQDAERISALVSAFALSG
jgi:transcriptional regulator with XRE-family HTH domain